MRNELPKVVSASAPKHPSHRRSAMSAEVSDEAVARGSGGVQSLDRAFAILEAMADAGGVIGLSQLAEKADLPLATIHRLVRTLVNLGYVRQEDSRQYS